MQNKTSIGTIKLGRFMLCIKRKGKKYSRREILSGEAWQANYFGYPRLGWKSRFMTVKGISRYMERKFNAQPEVHRRSFIRACNSQKRKNAR